ncbi:hypothetical protein [Streptomyces sp. NPDC003697]
MRVIRGAAAALLGVGALALCAPAVIANDDGPSYGPSLGPHGPSDGPHGHGLRHPGGAGSRSGGGGDAGGADGHAGGFGDGPGSGSDRSGGGHRGGSGAGGHSGGGTAQDGGEGRPWTEDGDSHGGGNRSPDGSGEDRSAQDGDGSHRATGGGADGGEGGTNESRSGGADGSGGSRSAQDGDGSHRATGGGADGGEGGTDGDRSGGADGSGESPSAEGGGGSRSPDGGDGGLHRGTFGFGVLPSSVAPGGQVTLRVERGRDGCRGAATVSSGVFDTVPVPPGRASESARVDPDARPGAVYQVTFVCDGGTRSADLRIVGGTGKDGGGPGPSRHDVQAGEGGTLAGFDLGEVGMGTALVGGSLGAAYYLARRRGDTDGV